MPYDPADLKLPPALLAGLDRLIAIRVPLGFGWKAGFTRPGVIFFAAMIGIWAAAFYSGNNLLYLCGAMITAMSLASIAQTMRLLKQFPDPAGLLPRMQANSVTVLRRYTDVSVGVSAVIAIDWNHGGQHFSLSGRCEVDRIRLDGRLKPSKRGLFRCHNIMLSSSAPLGLFLLVTERDSEHELVVMPEPVTWQPVSLQGERLNNQRSGGDEWLDLRAYVPGDPLSRVHWRRASGDIRDWKVKRFATDVEPLHEPLFRVDLRIPDGVSNRMFDCLLGRVWFRVMQQCDSAIVILGQQSFEMGKEQQWIALQRAIAGANPECLPPAGEGGLLLTLFDEI